MIRLKRCRDMLKVGLASAALIGFPASAADYIDTHAHLLGGGAGSVRMDSPKVFEGAANAAIREMDRLGIARTLVLPTPQDNQDANRYDFRDFIEVIRKHPDRFSFLGGGGLLNALIHKAVAEGKVDEDTRRLFVENAEMIANARAVGFGELAAEHFSLHRFAAFHAYESAPPDHELFLLLADIAARHGMPIDLHMEPIPEDMDLPQHPNLISPPNPARLHANLAGFERLLAHNRQAKIVWAHAGWDITGTRSVPLMRRLLRENANLYMNLKVAPKGTHRKSSPLDRNGQLKVEWLELFEEFPDHFMIGTDVFYSGGDAWGEGTAQSMSGLGETTLKVIDQLPDDLKRAIGRDNAVRLYKLSVLKNPS